MAQYCEECFPQTIAYFISTRHYCYGATPSSQADENQKLPG